ncbi:MAG: glycosyltransferase family 4 protein, partial [Candidatus Binatia bacterium]
VPLSRPLHIVVLNYRDMTHPEAGGAEVYLQAIFARIAAQGHHVTFVCAGHTGAPAQDRLDGVRILRVGNQATVNMAAAVAALRLARREGVDVFVESLCKLPFLLPVFTKIPVLPVVLHLFGHTVFYETNPLLASYVWLFEKLIPPVYRGLPFVALSASTASDIRRRGVRASRLDIIPPGLDLQRYAANAGTPSSSPLLVYVGRLKHYKGIDIVLRALAQVRETVPGVRLAVVGRGDDRTRLERLVCRLRLEDAVSFEGYVGEETKIQWLRQAWALVYPSPREGWGMSTVEAAACGTPVLASDAEGLRDAVREGSTGFLISHADVNAWAQRMAQILTDGQLRARMATAARQWAHQFDWDVRAEQMRTIVEQVGAGRSRRNGA